MAVRRGFVTQVGMGYEESFARADDYGLDFVEVMLDGAHERIRLDPDAVRESAADHDLDLLVHLPFALDIASPFEHVREGALRELLAAIETAVECGAEKGVVHASTSAWSAAWDPQELRPNLFETVRELDEFARSHDFAVCVENIPGDLLPAGEFPELFAETEARMTLDTGHARMNGLSSGEMGDLLATHGDRITHIHLNDTRKPADEHLPFGSGTIDFERVLAPLSQGWAGTLSLEVFTRDWDYIETSVEHLDALLG